MACISDEEYRFLKAIQCKQSQRIMEGDYSAYCGSGFFQGLISKKLLASEVVGEEFAFTLSQPGVEAIERYERARKREARERETLQLNREDTQIAREANKIARQAEKRADTANKISIVAVVASIVSIAIALFK